MSVAYLVQIVHFSGNGDYVNGDCVRYNDYSSAIQFMNEQNDEFSKTASVDEYSMALRPKLVDI